MDRRACQRRPSHLRVHQNEWRAGYLPCGRVDQGALRVGYDVKTKAAGRVWPWNLLRRGGIASWVRDIRTILRVPRRFGGSGSAAARHAAAVWVVPFPVTRRGGLA